jgi:hypothetical protein
MTARLVSPFGRLTRELRNRDGTGIARAAYARILSVADGTIGGIESGRLQQSRSYLEALERRYADDQELLTQLRETFNESPTVPNRRRSVRSRFEDDIRSLVSQGEFRDADGVPVGGPGSMRGLVVDCR